MKKTFVSIALATLLVAGALLGQQRANAAMDDRAQIDALYQKFTMAFRNKDVPAIMSVYVHDNSLFVFDVGTPRQHVGWEDYRKDWQDFFGSFKGGFPNFKIEDLSYTVSGDVAYGHSAQNFSGTDAKSSKTDRFTVRVTDVLRKAGGQWLIVQEHVSVPIDFTNMKPDFMSKM